MDGDTTTLDPAQRAKRLRQYLFPEAQGDHLYAVLDAAAIKGLLPAMAEHNVENCCLFSGELQPGVPERAPYLVLLDPASPFSTFLLTQGFGKAWGIFAATDADFKTVRKHFRTFLMVRAPDGRPLYFRYYDPRVFAVYLPTCIPRELDVIFGPIDSYAFEDEDPGALLRYRRRPAGLKIERISLEAPLPQ
jgi:hypothetical protein